jgi:hypothetical protein
MRRMAQKHEGYVMQVLDAWKRSLVLCKPTTIKLFAFVTIKAMRDAERILMVPWFGWLCVLFISMLYLSYRNLLPWAWLAAMLMTSCAKNIFELIFICATRPSIEYKNGAYFRHNIGRTLLFFCYFALLMLFVAAMYTVANIHYTGMVYGGREEGLWWYLSGFLGVSFFVFTCFFPLALLFYLDRKEGVMIAWERAIKMVWYNAPIFCLYCIIYGVLSLIVATASHATLIFVFGLTSFAYGALVQIMHICGLLGFSCLLTSLYIKLVHEQYALYFPEDTSDM